LYWKETIENNKNNAFQFLVIFYKKRYNILVKVILNKKFKFYKYKV